MNTIAEMKYTGDGGNAQRIFILDAQVGWKALVKDATQHLGGGTSQYDYWRDYSTVLEDKHAGC